MTRTMIDLPDLAAMEAFGQQISAKLAPIDCPMPALFSMISQGPSGVLSST